MKTKMKMGMVMLLLVSAAFAFTLAPNTQEFDVVRSDVKTITYTITNDGNQTHEYLVSTTGGSSSWFMYDSTHLSIAQGQSGTFKATILVPDTADLGINTAVVTVTEEATSNAETATITMDVNKWSYDDYAWVRTGEQLDINPLNDRMVILEMGDSYLRYDLYQGPTKKRSEALISENAYIEETEVRITLKDVSGGGQEAQLQVQTTNPSTTLSITDSGEVGVSGKLEPVISKYIFSLQQGKTESLTVIVRNLFNDVVEVKDITLFPIGSDLFQIEQAEMKNLQSQEDISIGIKIDATSVTPDTYTANLQVVGFYRNQKVQATIPFEVTVTQSANPTGVDGDIVATLDGTAETGQELVLKVQPVMQGDTLFVEPKDGMDSTAQASMVGDVLNKKLTFSKTGMYEVTTHLMRGGTILKSMQKTVIVSEPPTPPAPMTMQIYTTPSNPSIGDTIQLNVRDSETGDVVSDINLLLNGEAVSQGHSITLEDGNQYIIEAFSDDYAKTSKTLDYRADEPTVPTPDNPSLTATPSLQNVEVGDDVIMTLSESTDWEIKDAQTQEIVASDSGKIVSIKPMTGGILYVYAQDQKIGTIRVAAVTDETPWLVIVAMFVGAAFIVGAFLYKKRQGNEDIEMTDYPIAVGGEDELPPGTSEISYTE